MFVFVIVSIHLGQHEPSNRPNLVKYFDLYLLCIRLVIFLITADIDFDKLTDQINTKWQQNVKLLL